MAAPFVGSHDIRCYQKFESAFAILIMNLQASSQQNDECY
jgi:hypothetical protein